MTFAMGMADWFMMTSLDDWASAGLGEGEGTTPSPGGQDASSAQKAAMKAMEAGSAKRLESMGAPLMLLRDDTAGLSFCQTRDEAARKP
jgi:hypothetical protein